MIPKIVRITNEFLYPFVGQPIVAIFTKHPKKLHTFYVLYDGHFKWVHMYDCEFEEI